MSEMTIKQMLDAAGPVSRFVPAPTAELIMGLASAVRQLTEQRDAVVVEMVKLQNFCKNAAFDADYEAELGMERGGFTDALNDIDTPATSSAIAELKAEARDELIDKIEACFKSLSETAPTAELRSGAAGAAGLVSTFRQLRESKGAQS